MVDALDTFLAAKLVNTSWIKPSADVGPEGGESRKRRAGSRTQGSAPGYMNRQGKAMSGKPGPLPFGVLPPAAKSVEITNDTLTRARPGLHCLSAFCPPATSSQARRTACCPHAGHSPPSRSDIILQPSRLHCLSAFCPPATASAPSLSSNQKHSLHCLSAFCPPATRLGMMNGASPKASLHCLSAFCPPATVIQQWDTLAQKWVSIAFRRSAPRLLGSGNRDTNEQCPVSIAFRRSAPRLPDVPCRYGEPVENCLHCLSAFCPPATGRIERHCGWPIWRLHCLSAFCPPATGRLQYNAEKV